MMKSNVSKTISSRYNPNEIEPAISDYWLSNNLFSAKKDSRRKPYFVVIPPPNVTGILHMGHALNNTIQDVLIRYQRMNQRNALWMPGTDHAGIATQNVVEKFIAKQGLTKDNLGREKFIQRLWGWKNEHGSTIINQLKRIGASCDWQRLCFTMDEPYNRAVNRVFIKLFKKKLIYRGNYIINWCPRCLTALSDEEAAHKNVETCLYYIRYLALTPGGEKKPVIVATTRPETMFGDTAIAINPKDKRYFWLKNCQVILPLMERSLSIIWDEAVDPEFGTGVVKVTPAHDPLDFNLSQKHRIQAINIMNPDASLNQSVPKLYQGLNRFEARKILLAELKKNGFIEKEVPYSLAAGHCYRCDTLVEPRLSLQWFVKMKPLAKPAIKAVRQDKIKFYPQRWKKVYLNWMENIQDWCISRQIWWGHRIPVWYCKNCHKPNSLKGVIVSEKAPKKCPSCNSLDLHQEEDVLDTWFSSWLWPFATLGWPFNSQEKNKNREQKKEFKYFYPSNTLVTASEILFFWVARMIMASLEFTKKIPFSDVLIHGTVRDKKGVKMSKSLGNTIDPLNVVEDCGADALRFSLIFLAGSGADIHLSPEKFLMGRNFCNKIWNACRFIFNKIETKKINITKLKFSQEDESDAWILEKLNKTIIASTKQINSLRTDEAIKEIYNFFWHNFCDWYLELIKDDFSQKKAQNAVFILDASVKLLQPFIPFIAEKIYRIILEKTELKLPKSLLKASWPKTIEGRLRPKDVFIFDRLIESVEFIRYLRNDLGLGQNQLALEIKTSSGLEKFWQKNQSWFKRLVVADSLEYVNTMKRVFYQNKFWSINLAVEDQAITNLSDSLHKKIKILNLQVKKGESKLNNRKFLANAPKSIVEKEKIKLNDFSCQLARLETIRKTICYNDE